MKNINAGDFVLAAIIIVLFVFIFAAIGRAFEKNDARIAEEARMYENCVVEEYKMTPAHFYNQKGFYPSCDYEKNFNR